MGSHHRPASGYIRQTEAFDFRETTGTKPQSATLDDAEDLVRIEGGRGSNPLSSTEFLQDRRPNDQQLAAGFRALGDERQARETLMAQRTTSPYPHAGRSGCGVGSPRSRSVRRRAEVPFSGQAWH